MPRVKVQDMPYSLSFAGNGGSDKRVYLTTPLQTGATGDLTVGTWVLFRKSANHQTIFFDGFNYGSNQGYLFNMSLTNKLTIYAGSSAYPAANSTPLNTWIYVVFEIAGTTGNIYVNDMTMPFFTVSVDRKANGGTSNYYGAEAVNFNTMFGNLKDIFGYSGVLTASQKYELMNGGTPQGVTLNFRHKLNEGTGSTATDSSGNGNNGTIINGTWSTDTPSKLRTASSNRAAVQDIKSSLQFNGTSSKVLLTNTVGLPLYSNNTAYTILAWVKPSNNIGAQVNTIYADGSTAGTSPFFYININAANGNHNVGFFIRNDAAATVKSYNTVLKLDKNQWNSVAFVDNNGIVRVYVNGVLDTNSSSGLMDYTRTGTFTMDTSTWGAATRDATTFYLNGSLSNCRLYKTALTKEQVAQAFAGGEPDAANRVGKYDFQEGAGTTAYDTSGNGNHGTITAGTYTLDTPTKKRKEVNGNLVYNGDFEYAPPFVAATNTQYKEIDGTAGGRAVATGMVFGWSLSSVTGGGSAMYDNGAMKVSTTATGSSAYVRILGNANFRQNVIKCLPNTSYTARVRIKTNYVSGDATTGARLEIKGLSSTYSDTATYMVNNYIKTTTEWTEYTITFTTGSSIIYLDPMLTVNGSGGTGTLIMDAWFDDIQLRPTTAITRGTA